MSIRKMKGFTLIELMIAVAVVAILAGIAFPAYKDQTKKARRSGGEAALSSFAQAMERSFTEQGTYAEADGDGDPEAAGANVAPSIFNTEAPIDGSIKFYDLLIYEAGDTNYTIWARPKNIQAGDGRLELSSTGVRCWYKGADTSGGSCTVW